MCFAFVLISKEPVSRRPKQDEAGAYFGYVTVADCEEVRKVPFERKSFLISGRQMRCIVILKRMGNTIRISHSDQRGM